MTGNDNRWAVRREKKRQERGRGKCLGMAQVRGVESNEGSRKKVSRNEAKEGVRK